MQRRRQAREIFDNNAMATPGSLDRFNNDTPLRAGTNKEAMIDKDAAIYGGVGLTSKEELTMMDR